MPTYLSPGVYVEEVDSGSRPIEGVGTAVAAFVGRTLKGPVNRALPIASFGEFQQLFGGLWQPSTVGYAVEQFFENGGRQAFVVRVVNGARPPTLTLRAGLGELRLQGLEQIRAVSTRGFGLGGSSPSRRRARRQRHFMS